jgi:hypothetical protein
MPYEDAAEELHHQQLLRIHEAWSAYRGDLDDAYSVAAGRADDNVYANFCRTIVDVGVAFLFGEDITFNFNEKEDSRDEREQYLDDVWEFNKQGLLLQNLGINGAVTGHAFIKIMLGEPFPRIVVLDPSNVRVKSAYDDLEDIWCFVIQWNGWREESHKDVVYRQTIERSESGTSWTIKDEWTIEGNVGWTQIGEPEIWPYEFAPIVHCQNLPAPNEFWGTADLEPDVIGLQKAINKALSSNNRILRLYSRPRVYTKGLTREQQQQIRLDKEGVIHLPSSQAEMNILNLNADLESGIAFYLRLREVMHEISRIPEIASGKMENVGNLAGVALQILHRPLLQKTRQKRLTYGYLLQETSRRLLAIRTGGRDLIPQLQWSDILPTNEEERARTAVLQKQFGASNYSLLKKSGFDPDEERERIAEEAVLEAKASQQAAAQFNSASEEGDEDFVDEDEDEDAEE